MFSAAIDDIRKSERLSLTNKGLITYCSLRSQKLPFTVRVSICSAVFDPSKVSDHHAIIPSGKVPTEKVISSLSADERRLYYFIMSRLLCTIISNPTAEL